MNFNELKEATAKDCEEVANILVALASQVRDGDIDAFFQFWYAGGTEEGDSRIQSIREMMMFRFAARDESCIR